MTSLPDDAVAPPQQTRWFVVVATTLTGIVAAMQVGKVPPALPIIRAELGLSLVAAGWVTSMITLVGSLAGIACGIVTERVGGRTMVFFGLATLAIGSALGAIADDIVPLLISRALEGLGYVTIVVGGAPMVTAVTAPRHTRTALGAWSGYYPVGISFMIAVSVLFLAFDNWRGLWTANVLVIAAVAIVFAIATAGSAMPLKRPHGTRPARDILKAIKRPGAWVLGASLAVAGANILAVIAWLPTFFVEALGHSTIAAALLTALVFSFMGFGNAAGGWLLQRNIPRWRVLVVGNLIVGFLPLVIFEPATSDSTRLLLSFVFAFSAGIVPGASMSAIPLHAPTPRDIGIVAGVLLQGSQFGFPDRPARTGGSCCRVWRLATGRLVVERLGNNQRRFGVGPARHRAATVSRHLIVRDRHHVLKARERT